MSALRTALTALTFWCVIRDLSKRLVERGADQRVLFKVGSTLFVTTAAATYLVLS